MKFTLTIFIFVLFCVTKSFGMDSTTTIVKLETSLGDIILELDIDKAPKTVENFLNYVNSGVYDGTIFHRVISGFMIQGGGLTADMNLKPANAPIQNEAHNGLKNVHYTISMARTNAPHSATNQFFINTANNANLDHKGKTAMGWGYCVFGKVVKGTEVVDAIEKEPTTSKVGRMDVPVKTIVLKRAVIENPTAEKAPDKK